MTNDKRCNDTPFSMKGREISALYFTKAPGEEQLRAYARYGADPCWVPLPDTFLSIPDLQQARDMGRNIATDTGSYEDAHIYLRSADGNNMTTAFFTNAGGGGIQAGNADGYAPLNLQMDGGLLTYGGAEVATAATALIRRNDTITDFNIIVNPGIYYVGNVLGTANYPHIGGNNNGATWGYLVMYQPGSAQYFYPVESTTLNRGGGFWFRRTPADVWEYKNGVLEIKMRVNPVQADNLLITGDYQISGNLAELIAGGYPDSGATVGGIPFMVTVRKRWGIVAYNYAITQEAISMQESPANLTRKWIRSCFNWTGDRVWDAWNEVGLLRDVYTKVQLNTSGAGGAVHWNNVSNKPTIVSAETDPTVPVYVKAITITDISNWNAKEDTANKSTAIALGTSNALFPTQNAVKVYVDTAITNNNTAYIPATQKGAANGVATLGSNGKIPDAQIPAIAITNTSTVATQVAMLALTAEVGDVAVRTDINKSFILQKVPASTLANWVELKSPTITNTDQVPEGMTNLYFTNARSRSALSGTAPVSYSAATGVISMPQAGGSANGYLSAADWNTFNGKEPAFAKNTAFNKNFGSASGTVAEGNDSRIDNGQTAYSWGNHATFGYLTAVPNLQQISDQGNATTNELIIKGVKFGTGNTGGNENVAAGRSALNNATTGANYNVAIGSGSMENALSANNSTAVGEVTLAANATGICNTAIGNSAMNGNTSGNNNTALGAVAGLTNQLRPRGDYNLFVGRSAGQVEDSGTSALGDNNIFIGRRAGYNVTVSDQLRIGNRDETTGEHLIEGNMNAGTLNLNSSLSVKTMNPYTSGGYNYVVWNNATKKYETINPDFITTETDPVWTAAKADTLIFKGDIPGSANLNSYTETGIYHQVSNGQASTGINYPVPYAGKLEVVHAIYIYQTYHVYADHQAIYYRGFYNGAWSAWQQIRTKADDSELTQQLSLSGNDLTISGGNTVTLPVGDTSIESNDYGYGRARDFSLGWDTQGGIATGQTRYFQGANIDIAVLPDLHFFVCIDNNNLRLPYGGDWKNRILKFKCLPADRTSLRTLSLTGAAIYDFNLPVTSISFKATCTVEIKSSFSPMTGDWEWEMMSMHYDGI